MVVSLGHRKRSPLGGPEWRTTTWDEFHDFEQGLCDDGFDLAAILQDLTELSVAEKQVPVSIADRLANLASLVERFVNLDASLVAWYKRFTEWASAPLYWVDPHGDQDRTFFVDQSFSFQSLSHAHVIMDFWSLNIILGFILNQFQTNLLTQFPSLSPEPVFLHTLCVLTAKYSMDIQLTNANNIVSSLAFLGSVEMGQIGIQRGLFAIRVALMIFRELPGPYPKAKADQTAHIMHKISMQKGLKYAGDLVDDRVGEWK
jgi:hypothetical protein